MARCGCNTAMTTTCDAIMTCIAANLGMGLDFNEATREIELRISTDGGNVAAIGTDEGFYSPASTGPGEMTWPKTVATLPAQAIAANGGSNLVGPSTAPALIEYSIGHNIDMYTTGTYALADGTAFESVAGPTFSLTIYTDNPGNLAGAYASSLTQQMLHYDAGTRVSPTSRNSNAPTALLTPDGGWGGFYAPVYKPRTISETLRIIRGRMVVQLLPQRIDLDTARVELGIRATVDAVVHAGAQDWCIIEVPASLADNSQAPINDWVAIVTDAGITAGVNLAAEMSMPDPFTPAEIVASGATWVTVTSPGRPADGNTDVRITALVTAGLEVTVQTTGRQYWTTHAFGLGARVVRAPDAVYARGSRGQVGDLNYRDTMIPGLETRTTAVGALTPVTDVETAMWHSGFARTDLPGRWFPPQYGWDGTVRTVNNQLLGTISPIPDTTNFELRLRLYRHSGAAASTLRWAGLFWGAADDRDISNVPGGPTNPNRNGYACIVRETTVSGVRMGIYRYDAGSITTLVTSINGPGWAADAWTSLIVTVTGSGINFSAVGPTTSASVSTVDATYRGPYVFYAWNDSGPTTPQYHGYNNYDLGAVPVIYEAG